uniref:Uncharacterized protein n=1 Tax=Rhizophora mucronata TaxID=61149 RepID=A0A2P2LET1_RHIMU
MRLLSLNPQYPSPRPALRSGDWQFLCGCSSGSLKA